MSRETVGLRHYHYHYHYHLCTNPLYYCLFFFFFFFFFCQESLQQSKSCMEVEVESWNDAKTRTEQVICIFEKSTLSKNSLWLQCFAHDLKLLHTAHTLPCALSLSLLHTIWSFCTRPYHCPPKFKCLKPRVALTSRWMTSEIHHASRQKKKGNCQICCLRHTHCNLPPQNSNFENQGREKIFLTSRWMTQKINHA